MAIADSFVLIGGEEEVAADSVSYPIGRSLYRAMSFSTACLVNLCFLFGEVVSHKPSGVIGSHFGMLCRFFFQNVLPILISDIPRKDNLATFFLDGSTLFRSHQVALAHYHHVGCNAHVGVFSHNGILNDIGHRLVVGDLLACIGGKTKCVKMNESLNQ